MKSLTNSNSNNARLTLLQPPSSKQWSGGSLAAFASQHRLWLVASLSFFTLASLATLLATTTTTTTTPTTAAVLSRLTTSPPGPTVSLPRHVSDALIHYGAASIPPGRMLPSDIRAIAAVIRRRAPCNVLVFGAGPESPLWRALNGGGRTVFLDENEYYITYLEDRHSGLEAYEVSYTTTVGELGALLAAAMASVHGECRPTQNLLFSECRLALNGLPNALYEVAWDVVVVDGPRGYSAGSPGRMSAIFTAAVMARWRNAGPTEVLVHDYEREVERVCSEEFLCVENMVGAAGQLAHFVIPSGGAAEPGGGFCANRSSTDAAESASQ